MSSVSITSPLNLRQHLRLPRQGIDAVPFIDLLLIGLFFALFNSQFLFPPGLQLALPEADAGNLGGVPVSAVATVLPPPPSSSDGAGMVLFLGDIMPQADFAEALRAYLADHQSDSPILLLKMDKRCTIAQLTAISDAARNSGFASVQLAADERAPAPDAFSR